MIKLYFKIQNNMLTTNLLYLITALVLIVNIAIRIFPGVFISFPVNRSFYSGRIKIAPISLFTYCDVYLLLLFIILIFFFLGTDFTNSMEEITLAVGGSRTNKFMARKLGTILFVYLILYVISFANIYSLYSTSFTMISLKDIIFSSLTTNIFIISLSLFVLFVFKDIAVSTTIITAYYLIEEALWRCKIMDKYGILGHIYQYYDYVNGEFYKIRIVYLMLSVVLLFITYKISKRKKSVFDKFFWKKSW